MGKKHFSIITIFISLFSMFSCKKNDVDKVILYRKENLNNTILIQTKEELNDLLNYKDCFLFVTFDSCKYCIEAKEKYINPYIEKNNAVLYEVHKNVYDEAYSESLKDPLFTSSLYKGFNGTPFFFFIQDKKIKDEYSGLFTSQNAFEDFLNKNSFLSNYYLLNDVTKEVNGDNVTCYMSQIEDDIAAKIIDKTQLTNEEYESLHNTFNSIKNDRYDSFGYNDLDLLYNSNQDYIINFTWRRCNDCKNYSKMVLDDFLYKNKDRDKKIYFYDLDSYKRLKSSTGDIYKLYSYMFNQFTKRYNLYESISKDQFDHNLGMVPTIIKKKDGVITRSVFSNYESPSLDESNHLYYQVAFYKKLTEIKSTYRVSSLDKTKDDYQKAKKQLDDKLLKEDAKLNLDFLNE